MTNVKTQQQIIQQHLDNEFGREMKLTFSFYPTAKLLYANEKSSDQDVLLIQHISPDKVEYGDLKTQVLLKLSSYPTNFVFEKLQAVKAYMQAVLSKETPDVEINDVFIEVSNRRVRLQNLLNNPDTVGVLNLRGYLTRVNNIYAKVCRDLTNLTLSNIVEGNLDLPVAATTWSRERVVSVMTLLAGGVSVLNSTGFLTLAEDGQLSEDGALVCDFHQVVLVDGYLSVVENNCEIKVRLPGVEEVSEVLNDMRKYNIPLHVLRNFNRVYDKLLSLLKTTTGDGNIESKLPNRSLLTLAAEALCKKATKK